jgi:hypothetical protein
MSDPPLTNLEILKPSRKRLHPGDVFALYIGDEYSFGRIITVEAKPGYSMRNAVLIYVYRTRMGAKELPERSELRPDNLIVSPMMTNRLPWSRGYFEFVANIELDDADILPQHCFRSSYGEYFDESLNRLPGAVEPVGDWGLHSFRTIDDELSDALGIPRVPVGA